MMEARLKNTLWLVLGLVLGLVGSANTAYGQLDLEWEVSVDKDPAKLPFQYRHFVHEGTSVDESSFSGSLIIWTTYRNPAEESQHVEEYHHISPHGKAVGSETIFVDIQKQTTKTKFPVFVGEDWMIVAGSSHELEWQIHENEYRLATGQGDYVTAAMPAELSTTQSRHGWANLFTGKKDLRRFYPETDPWNYWQQPNGFYRVKETSERVYVQKFSPRLRVTDLHLNSAPQSSISRTDDGIALSTATEAGQAYRIQSSQDLKQWSDEEIIQGDGSTKSVQRPSDKTKEFLRVVEE